MYGAINNSPDVMEVILTMLRFKTGDLTGWGMAVAEVYGLSPGSQERYSMRLAWEQSGLSVTKEDGVNVVQISSEYVESLVGACLDLLMLTFKGKGKRDLIKITAQKVNARTLFFMKDVLSIVAGLLGKEVDTTKVMALGSLVEAAFPVVATGSGGSVQIPRVTVQVAGEMVQSVLMAIAHVDPVDLYRLVTLNAGLRVDAVTQVTETLHYRAEVVQEGIFNLLGRMPKFEGDLVSTQAASAVDVKMAERYIVDNPPVKMQVGILKTQLDVPPRTGRLESECTKGVRSISERVYYGMLKAIMIIEGTDLDHAVITYGDVAMAGEARAKEILFEALNIAASNAGVLMQNLVQRITGTKASVSFRPSVDVYTIAQLVEAALIGADAGEMIRVENVELDALERMTLIAAADQIVSSPKIVADIGAELVPRADINEVADSIEQTISTFKEMKTGLNADPAVLKIDSKSMRRLEKLAEHLQNVPNAKGEIVPILDTLLTEAKEKLRGLVVQLTLGKEAAYAIRRAIDFALGHEQKGTMSSSSCPCLPPRPIGSTITVVDRDDKAMAQDETFLFYSLLPANTKDS
jgi:hypothetical protein